MNHLHSVNKKKRITHRQGIPEQKNHFFLFLCIVLLFHLSFCTHPDNNSSSPAVHDGYIDLRNWDSDAHSILALEGEWKFRWMDSDERYAAAEYNDSDWDVFHIPGVWNKQAGTGKGYAWFRLEVQLNTQKDLGVYLEYSNTSYVLYVNGKEILRNGIPGESKKSTIPEAKPQFEPLPDAQTIIFAWKISNYHDILGGPFHPIRIGKIESIKYMIFLNNFMNIFILGVISIIILLFSIQWLFRRKEKAPLFFALFCFMIFLRFLSTSHLLEQLLHPLSAFIMEVYTLSRKLAYGSVPLIWVIFLHFLDEMFSKDIIKESSYEHITIIRRVIYKVLFYIFLILGISLFIFILTTPIEIFTTFLGMYGILTIFAALFALAILIMAIINRNKYAVLTICGFAVFFLFIINDILYINSIIYTMDLLPVGMVIFLLFPAIVFSLQSAEAFNKTESAKEKALFFINFAHETKTPLTLICNYLEKYIKDHGESRDLLIIRENFEKLKKDMINFLDSEKLEFGNMVFNNFTDLNISACMRNKILLFNESARKKNITIVPEIEEDIIIHTDEGAIDRIVNNLLENAIRYTGENGKINFTLSCKENKVYLTIQDNGKGMTKDEQKHIFDKLYQISNNKRSIQGMGIGLFITKKIIDQLHGTISVTSRINKGSTFQVILKAAEPGTGKKVVLKVAKENFPEVNVVENTDTDATTDTEKLPTVLIVEDEKDLCDLMKNILSQYYTVYSFYNPKEALEKIKEIPKLDVILSDIMMDGMDGYDFLSTVQRNPRFCDVPFIFVTAKTSEADTQKGYAAGVMQYIKKPFTIKMLRLQLDTILHNREKTIDKKKMEMSVQIHKVLNEGANSKTGEYEFNMKCLEYNITKRQKEIILLVKQGKKNRQIAKILHISENTVKATLNTIYDRCNVDNRVQLIYFFS